ncbi:uncharacterized protein METZ01_LOCUS15472 [marine metagenome]|uniref:Type II secretion system protein J n=1 Tax=marine metagenome TaxID=408172 RepID=A0A381P8S1_9ZZZZ
MIEVMISMVIVSLILLISTNILESSISSRNQTLNVLDDVKEFNLISNTLRRDFRQAMNVPMRDTFGLPVNATFYSAEQSNRVTLTTKVNHSNTMTSNLRRIEYLLQDGALVRRQYYAVNPYMSQESFESKLFEDVDDLSFGFSDGSKWYSQWPNDEVTSRTMPQLIQVKLVIDNHKIEWLIAPRIKHEYQF